MLSRARDQRLEVELVGDTAVVLLRPEQGPPAAVLKVARGPLRAAELGTQRRVLAELAIHHGRQPAGEANTLSLDFRSIPSEEYVYFPP
jgi:hypothetical protein